MAHSNVNNITALFCDNCSIAEVQQSSQFPASTCDALNYTQRTEETHQLPFEDCSVCSPRGHPLTCNQGLRQGRRYARFSSSRGVEATGSHAIIQRFRIAKLGIDAVRAMSGVLRAGDSSLSSFIPNAFTSISDRPFPPNQQERPLGPRASVQVRLQPH